MKKQQYWWLIGLMIVLGGVFGGALVGGIVGYSLAKSWDTPTSTEAPAGVIQTVAVAQPDGSAAQSLVITEESGAVQSVSKVLPAVVTVQSGQSSGSGFFISADGYVVTNNHVVEGARDFMVIYAAGGQSPARLVGTAPEFDLAVLKVEGAVPGIAEWGDSGQQELGANVIAIGSALGEYRNSVTKGVLSGFNRQLGNMGGLLQTDAAINSGNSGGPLINLAGQVVGINTMVVRGDFTPAEGLGFAIPSNIARTVVKNLIETGQARYPFLGIQFQPLNPQQAGQMGLSITEGALLQTVIENTPAAQAGLQAGDVIVALNGRPVDERNSLVSLLLEHVAGDTVTLDVLRNGQPFQTQLTLAERA